MARLSLTLLATIATYLLLSCAHARYEPLSTSGAEQATWEVEQAGSDKDVLNGDAAIQELRKETNRLGSRIYELEDTLKRQELRIYELEDTLKRQESRSQRKWQENAQVKQEMSKELTQLKRMLSRNMSNSDLLSPGNNIQSVINVPVAFSAYVNSDDYRAYQTNINKTLVFDTVLTNEGSGYNNATGVFTAPISGVYVFSYALVASYSKHTALVLTLEGKIKSLTSSKDANPGGNVVILSVTKGAKVRIEGMNQGTITSYSSSGYTSFSGFLLFVI